MYSDRAPCVRPARWRVGPLVSESSDLGYSLDDGLRHLVAADVGGRRDALHLQLEFVDVARPAQRLLVRDQALREETEDRLIEGLHAVLRRAGGNGARNQVRFLLVDDAVADERGTDHHLDGGA